MNPPRGGRGGGGGGGSSGGSNAAAGSGRYLSINQFLKETLPPPHPSIGMYTKDQYERWWSRLCDLYPNLKPYVPPTDALTYNRIIEG